MSAIRTIENIIEQARHTDDPERLRELALQLRDYSAWDASERVQNKALAIERKQAEEA